MPAVPDGCGVTWFPYTSQTITVSFAEAVDVVTPTSQIANARSTAYRVREVMLRSRRS
jgi:hypothetical protein